MMRRLRVITYLVAFMVIVLLVTACGGIDDHQLSDNENLDLHEEKTLNNTLDTASEETDGDIENVEPDAKQQLDPEVEALLEQFETKHSPKVIPLSVAMSELLNELAVTPVGVPSSSMALPEAYDDLPKVGSTIQPDLEQLVSLQPDVVLVPASLQDSLGSMLEPTLLPVAFLPVDSLDEMKLTLRVLSVLFDKEAEAEQFLANFAAEEQSIVTAYEQHEQPKVMFLFGSAESLMFMNEHTYAGSLAQQLGAINVVSELLQVKETYAPLDMESIVAVNPDVIFLIAHGDPAAVAKQFEEDIKNNGVWEKLNAFQNGKMQTLPYELFGSASLTKAIAAYGEMVEIMYD